jgi:hypothetical protein
LLYSISLSDGFGLFNLFLVSTLSYFYNSVSLGTGFNGCCAFG